MRTNSKELESLVRKVEQSEWFDWQQAVWVMAFLTKLLRFGAAARHDSPRGKRVANRLAFHLGQLVEDPLLVRQEEQEAQDERHKRYQSALVDFQRFGWQIKDYDRWSAESSAAAIEGAFNDALLSNRLIRQFLTTYGLLETMKQEFPAMHTSWDDSADPFFTQEAWPRWWNWAQTEFFATDKPVLPD